MGNTMETEIKELDTMKAYIYLGVEESHNMAHKMEKDRLKKEYVRRLRLILSTELSAKNKMQAIGSLAIPVLRYSFGIINWHQEEIHKLDRKIRKMLTIHGQHHPKTDVDHLYCNEFAGFYFTKKVYYTPKLNTPLLFSSQLFYKSNTCMTDSRIAANTSTVF
jgi:hypothetical protein